MDNIVTALDVANNFIKRALADKVPLSPMKLQKLIYFLYAKYYLKTNKCLFSERFVTWKYGPVLETVHQSFMNYKSSNIDDYYLKQGKMITVKESESKVFKECIDTVWSKYKGYNGIALSDITHQEGTAWRKAYDAEKWFLDNEDILIDGERYFGTD